MTISQNVRMRRVKRRMTTGVRLREADLRPTRREAMELVTALTECNFAADALLAEMEYSVMLLKDAWLEAETALSLIATSNKNSALRSAAAVTTV